MRFSLRRGVAAATAGLAAGALAVATGITPTDAATTTAVTPSRVIRVGEFSGSGYAVADDGTMYVGSGPIEVWAAGSNGVPTVTKTFTGMSVAGAPALRAGTGLAWADSSAASVTVMNPGQAGGAYVATRTITGATTQIDDPTGVAWASDGSLWVVDEVGSGGYEFLRFAPGANGNVAPVQQIGGSLTGFSITASNGLGTPFVAALPNHGLAVAPAGVRPTISVFTGSQSGNVAPARRIKVATPTPSYLTQGVSTDANGRIYIGAGDVYGGRYGFLDVFTSSGTKLLELSGARQDFRIPLFPAASPNGTLALINATIIALGGSQIVDAQIEVFKPLFAKAGAVRSLKVTRTTTTQTVTWLAPTNKGGTPPSYRVVVRKGTRTLLTRTVAGTRLAIARRVLPKGTLTVTVSAVNAGGAGPAVSRTFTN